MKLKELLKAMQPSEKVSMHIVNAEGFHLRTSSVMTVLEIITTPNLHDVEVVGISLERTILDGSVLLIMIGEQNYGRV